MVLLPQHQFCLANQGLKQILVPSMQAHVPGNSSQSQKQIQVPHMSSPTALVNNGLLSFSGSSFHYPLDKTSWSLSKPHSFSFEMSNPALVWEPQYTPPMDPNKCMCPRSLCLHPTLISLCGPLRHTVYLLRDL